MLAWRQSRAAPKPIVGCERVIETGYSPTVASKSSAGVADVYIALREPVSWRSHSSWVNCHHARVTPSLP